MSKYKVENNELISTADFEKNRNKKDSVVFNPLERMNKMRIKKYSYKNVDQEKIRLRLFFQFWLV